MNDSSTFLDLLRVSFSLAFVLGLIWVAARMLRSANGVKAMGGSSDSVEVLERKPLGRHASVNVVRVGEKSLVLGVTETQITLLGEGPAVSDPDELPPPVEVDLDDLDLETGSIEQLSLAGPTTVSEDRRIGLLGAQSAARPRMSFVDALRERSVRRGR